MSLEDTDPITEMTIYIKHDVCEIGNMILHIVANLNIQIVVFRHNPLANETSA